MLDLVNDEYIVFDLETTGLNANMGDSIIEIGAVKIKEGKIIDRFNELIYPNRKLPNEIIEITGITNEMLKGAPTLKAVLTDFKEFIKGYIVYARNSAFINKFLTYYGLKNGIEIPMAVYDCYDDISKFLHVRYIQNYLEKTEELDAIKYAKAIIKNID